jgi:hypothetical protein
MGLCFGERREDTAVGIAGVGVEIQDTLDDAT